MKKSKYYIIKLIIEKVKEQLNIDEDIILIVKEMKNKVASFSFRTKVLKLNKILIDNWNKKLITYIVTHELIHLKSKSLYHGMQFNENIMKDFTYEDMEKYHYKLLDLMKNQKHIN